MSNRNSCKDFQILLSTITCTTLIPFMVTYWLDIRESEENLFYSPASVTILSFTSELILPPITRNGISKSYSLSSKYFLLDFYFEIVEVEGPIFWLPDANCWLFGKVPDAGKDWGQKKRASKDEMAGWHHQFNGHDLGKLWEVVRDQEAWPTAVHGVTRSQTRLGNWTTTASTSVTTTFPLSLRDLQL